MKFSILLALFLVLFSLPVLGNENPINYEIDQLSEVTDYLDITQDKIPLDSYMDSDVEYASGDISNLSDNYVTLNHYFSSPEKYSHYLAPYVAFGNLTLLAYTVFHSPAKDCNCRYFSPS